MARTRLPWDVPVDLVPATARIPVGVEVLEVRPPRDLPGVIGLRLTVGRLEGRRVLVAVAPIRPPAQPVRSSENLSSEGLGAVLRRLGRPVPVLAVGTPLQRRVLSALAAVPAGEVVTYGALAARAGASGAARAAARVMATNRVPLVLPCHRVVPAAGGVGAYGWGSEVKAALLALEGAEVPGRRSAGGGRG